MHSFLTRIPKLTNDFFNTWLAAMGDHASDVIMSKQCESIRNVIKEVMPNTLHSIVYGTYFARFLRNLGVWKTIII